MFFTGVVLVQLIEELTRELDDVRHHHGDSQSERSVRRHELEQQLVRLKEVMLAS